MESDECIDGVNRCAAKGSGWACGRTADRYPFTKGMCRSHNMQRRRGKALTPLGRGMAQDDCRICSFGECERAVSAKGLCCAHYQQMRSGKQLTPLRKKRRNGAYRKMVETGVVECLGCGENRPVSHYSSVGRSDEPRPYCKPCNAERVRLGNYNVTRGFIDRLLAFQGGRCAICGVTDESARTLHIDHDHTCCPGRRSCGKSAGTPPSRRVRLRQPIHVARSCS